MAKYKRTQQPQPDKKNWYKFDTDKSYLHYLYKLYMMPIKNIVMYFIFLF